MNSTMLETISTVQEQIILIGGETHLLPLRVPTKGEYVVIDALNIVCSVETFTNKQMYELGTTAKDLFRLDLDNEQKEQLNGMVISAMALDLSDIFGDMFGIIIPKNAGIHYYKQGYTVYSPENEILDPAKPDTKPETQPETKPQPKPVPSPETQPQPKPVPSPNPQDRPLPPKVNPIGVEEKKPDEANPADEKPFELPEFCKWASWFCEGDIDKKDTDIDIDEMPIPTNSVNISFGGSCPTPKNFSFSIGGRSMVFSMSFDPICRIATSFGGIVKIISTIIAAYILTGIKS